MKIALVHTPLWGRGGAERQILKLAIELKTLGNEVELFTPAINEEKCYPELLKNLKINVTAPNLFPFEKQISQASSTEKVGEMTTASSKLQRVATHQFYMTGLPAMLSLGKAIPKGFDVINNHNPPTEWAAFIAKRKLKIPIVWMCNEPPSWFYFQERGIRKQLNWPLFNIWDKITVNYIDEILVLSHVAENMVRHVYNRPSRVVRTGIDVEKFQGILSQEAKEKYGWQDDFVLLQVANFGASKRQSDSIRAMYHLSKSYGNVKLVLDGSGPEEYLRKLSAKLGVAERVLFRHSKSDRELAEIYAACDVFIFPAQITWGLAVIEAMASAKPVVVTKGCGAAEIIQDKINGVLVEHANPEDIAKKVGDMISDVSLRQRLGKNAHDYVKASLSWEKYAEQMQTIFKRVLQQKRTLS